MLESLFNKFAGQACNFIKKRLYHRYFPVNFTRFLRKFPVPASDICSLITFYLHKISLAKLARTS